jgi:hypothetical protein
MTTNNPALLLLCTVFATIFHLQSYSRREEILQASGIGNVHRVVAVMMFLA